MHKRIKEVSFGRWARLTAGCSKLLKNGQRSDRCIGPDGLRALEEEEVAMPHNTKPPIGGQPRAVTGQKTSCVWEAAATAFLQING